MQSLFQRYRVVLLHLSFWCAYLSFVIYQITSFRKHETDLPTAFLHGGVQAAFNIVVSYFNYFYLLPRFLKQKKIWRYLLEFSVPFAILITLRVHLQRYLVDGYTYKEGFFYSSVYVVQLVVVTLFIVLFIAMLRFAKEWFEFEATRKEVENERLLAELNFLKAQINPHFLFNTLNNLYYLAYSQSANTTEVIAKLSQMMRYMLYDTNQPKVLLSKEVEYMQNYISLERLRLNDQIPIQFEVKGNVNEVRVAPLILITFLENAFKHGVSNNRGDSWVKVNLALTGREFVYTVENSKHGVVPEVGKSGIGLQNVQRRLELSYPGHYRLEVEDLPDRYIVHLTLTLSE